MFFSTNLIVSIINIVCEKVDVVPMLHEHDDFCFYKLLGLKAIR